MGLAVKFKNYLELVKFEHSIFALPFTLSAMILASKGNLPSIKTILLVIIAMISARTAAMALNRIIDRKIDASNPRTAQREIPTGKIKVLHAEILVFISILVMVLSVLQLPEICIQLLPLAIFLIFIYSYTKRFTVFCHYVLGFILGSAAIGGWLATSGQLTLQPVLWGASVMFWVAGFDIIYSLQDKDFDIGYGLYSIPAKFGLPRAIIIARITHIFAVILFAMTFYVYNQSLIYLLIPLFIAITLLYEHSLFSDKDLSKINAAFFKANGIISIGVFIMIFVLRYLQL